MTDAQPTPAIMLTIEHNRVEENDAQVLTESSLDLTFPCGLFGFEQIKDYKLHAFPDIHPFLWLEAQNDDRGLCFLAVPPLFVVEYYTIELTEEDVNFLSLTDPADAVVLNIATIHADGSVTVNLKGPLVYNRHNLMARQIVPKNAASLSIKHPLAN